jgi:hypothetical protein
MTSELRGQVLGAMKALQQGNRVALQNALKPYEREIRDYDLDRDIILSSDTETSAPQPETKVVAGKTYVKTPKGWQEQ